MKNRMVQNKLFTEVAAIFMTPEAKWFLVGLMKAADDDGRVVLDPRWLCLNVPVKGGQSPEDITAWLTELQKNELLSPYEVNAKPYAEIVGWNERDSYTYQAIPSDKRSKWTNPAPTTMRGTNVAPRTSPEADTQERIQRLGHVVPASESNHTDDARSALKRRAVLEDDDPSDEPVSRRTPAGAPRISNSGQSHRPQAPVGQGLAKVRKPKPKPSSTRKASQEARTALKVVKPRMGKGKAVRGGELGSQRVATMTAKVEPSFISTTGEFFKSWMKIANAEDVDTKTELLEQLFLDFPERTRSGSKARDLYEELQK